MGCIESSVETPSVGEAPAHPVSSARSAAAVRSGTLDELTALCTSSDTFTVLDFYTWEPVVYTAIRRQDPEVLQLVLEHGGVETLSTVVRYHPRMGAIELACSHGNVAVLRMLAGAGALPRSGAAPPSLIAAYFGHVAIIVTLMELWPEQTRAELSSPSSAAETLTACHVAAGRGHKYVLHAVLRLIRETPQFIEGQAVRSLPHGSALHAAAAGPNHWYVGVGGCSKMSVLVADIAPAPSNAPPADAYTDVIRTLVNAGLPVDEQWPGPVGCGRTPLMMACYFRHIPAIRLLLELGASVDTRDDAQNDCFYHWNESPVRWRGPPIRRDMERTSDGLLQRCDAFEASQAHGEAADNMQPPTSPDADEGSASQGAAAVPTRGRPTVA